MTDAYLDLWPTYGSALIVPVSDPHAELTRALDGRNNLAVVGATPESARNALLASLRTRAKQSYDRLLSTTPVAGSHEGWLVVDVPMPNHVEPVQLMHRMIRRLYFAAVLHGLGEVPSFRDTVQALRSAFLQTRGSVTQDDGRERVDRLGAEVGLTLKPIPEFNAKLTAGDEVKVIEKLSASLQRLDLLEAEDELMYDLKILQRLELFVSAHVQLLSDGARLPRWERVRSWFKQVYDALHFDRGVQLRPAFVFEVSSVFNVLALVRFLTQAAGLARAHYAQVILVGGAALAEAITADDDLGRPVFRGAFTPVVVADAATVLPAELDLLDALIARPPETWTPEVLAIAKRMRQNLTSP